MFLEKAETILVDDLKVCLVDCVGGGCNVYAPNIFKELGFFPEYPLFGVEDGALCRGARVANYPVAMVDNVKLEHLPTVIPDSIEYRTYKDDLIKTWQEETENKD